ncbi:chemotaxis protein CheW [Methanospirillum lacunae]|uniref:Chemotaxis protein CheW n=1 Tax=Methanospirillum lacunae TaxID=668570 RepID=A0A2V2NF61_9EURY|nr:chemotaxis protein CheW [Methanospirillum lacunae]PWR74231.1 chemotaxis protein CheW [Methanospirillum lacunae]
MEESLQIKNQDKSDTIGDEVQVVEFILGEDKFAINLFDVREIVESFRITPMPHSASYIKGIIDLRGEITTVIDLKKVLKISKNTSAGQVDSRFIVLDESVTAVKTGILVDDVTSVLTVPVSDIDQASQNGAERTFILGIIKKSVGDRERSRKELIIWIDIKDLLTRAAL